MSSIQTTVCAGILGPIVALYFIKASHDVIVKWLELQEKSLNSQACACILRRRAFENITILPYKSKKVVFDPVCDKNKTACETGEKEPEAENTPKLKPFNVAIVDNYTAK